jgi:hypothetical protein
LKNGILNWEEKYKDWKVEYWIENRNINIKEWNIELRIEI